MGKAEHVLNIVIDCLFKNEEVVNGKPILEPIAVEGITAKFYFHPQRLVSHIDEINMLLNDFPDEFYIDKGGGSSFLKFCLTKDGKHWGEHQSMEMLICLGIAIGRVAYNLPRKLWDALPGRMPYICIKPEIKKLVAEK